MTDEPSPFKQGELGEDVQRASYGRAEAAEAVCQLLLKYLRSKGRDWESWAALKDAVRAWHAYVAAGVPIHPEESAT